MPDALPPLHPPALPLPPRRGLPPDLDPAAPAQIAAQVRALLDRAPPDAEALEAWVADRGALDAAISGEFTRRMIAMNRDTADAGALQALAQMQEEVLPELEVHDHALDSHLLASPALDGAPRLGLLVRASRAAAALFREANIPRNVELMQLSNRYQELQGAIAVEVDGVTLTAPAAGAVLLEVDRGRRERASRALGARARADAAEVDAIFDQMVRLRHACAVEAGLPGYTSYGFIQMGRFDYTPEDAADLCAAISRVVVPGLRRLADERQRRLGLDALRPWDTRVSLLQTPPRPLFSDEAGLVALVREIAGRIDPRFADELDLLHRNGLLDLMSRPNKAPGGYNAPIEDWGVPFIFHNAVGTRRDVSVLLHELGHAVHTLLCRDQPIVPYRRSPIEFAEVASMSVELMALDALDGLLPADEVREYRLEHLTGVLGLFGSVARLDAFQRQVYAEPGLSPAERRARWVALEADFAAPIDWSGLEGERELGWHGVPHPFVTPLYMLEYGIAQLGALQVREAARAQGRAAIDAFRGALALGGAAPLPALFEAAGARFGVDAPLLERLVPPVVDEVEALLAGP